MGQDEFSINVAMLQNPYFLKQQDWTSPVIDVSGFTESVLDPFETRKKGSGATDENILLG